MKRLALVVVGMVSACSTVTDPGLPTPPSTVGSEAVDAAQTDRNGPSAVPRAGWVETVSGWYPSMEACLQQRRLDAAGTPLSVAEECLEPNR